MSAGNSSARDGRSPYAPAEALAGVRPIGAVLSGRANATGRAIVFEGRQWTWAEYIRAATGWAGALRRRDVRHVAILFDNVPAICALLAAGALSGTTIVPLNPTRGAVALVEDATRTDADLVLLGDRFDQVADTFAKTSSFDTLRVDDWGGSDEDTTVGAFVPVVPALESLFALMYTSGTSGRPKAVRMTNRRIARGGSDVAATLGLTERDIGYASMPLYHSNGIITSWAATAVAGCPTVLKRRFSASQFLPDVREHGITYFNYVGKPLTYILSAVREADTSGTALRLAFGNEANPVDIVAFAEQFGCRVIDGYGATEGGVQIRRDQTTPGRALGRPPANVKILDPETGRHCPPAQLDGSGRLVNPDEAIGEIVNVDGASMFDGYYEDAEATAQRLRDGMYWSGDLAYADSDGYVYFVSRTSDWLRVDGENIPSAAVEEVVGRFPGIGLVAVYGVASESVGDDLMVALMPGAATGVDGAALVEFLADQPDFATKWMPRYLRVVDRMPTTASHKILKRDLARTAWTGDGPVWWRPDRDSPMRLMTDADRRDLAGRFVANGRRDFLPGAAPAPETSGETR